MKQLRTLIAFSVLILSAHMAAAEERCPDTMGLNDYINCMLGANDLVQGRKDASGGQEDADRVANADSLGGSKLDFAKKFFTLLDLGDFKEDPNGITFNFNPELFPSLPMQFTPRVVIHKAELYEPVVKEIDRDGGPVAEGMRADLKERLKKSFGDFDDTELRIIGSWRHLRRTDGASALAGEIFESSGIKGSAFDLLAAKGDEWTLLNPDFQATTPVNQLGDPLEARVKSEVKEFLGAAADDAEALHQMLQASRFYDLGRLVANDPQFSFDGSYRSRKGAGGPANEWGATVRYEYGLVSYGQYLGWATRGKRGGESRSTLEAYLDRPAIKNWLQRQPRVSALLEYSRIGRFSLDLPEDHLSLNLDSIRRFTGKLTYGQVLSSNPGSKFDFEARYDDFSDDLTKQNRFVTTATWTQKLTDRQAQVAGGTQLVISLVYANKPEFRDAVDKDLGMRAGLKWSLDGGDKGGAKPAESGN